MFLWQGPGGRVLAKDGKILWGVLLNTSLILSSDLSFAGPKNHFLACLEALRAGKAFKGMYTQAFLPLRGNAEAVAGTLPP